MRTFLLMTFSLVSFLAVSSSSVFACGESMFRVGKGVNYRAYSAPIPGSILVYARTDSERAVATQLQDAGHQVQIVSTDIELAQEIQNHQFDVVVAPYSKREVIEVKSGQTITDRDWVPVVGSGSGSAKLAKSIYRQTVNADDDVRKYLKAIHKNLKAQDA